jgi:hypothetical protein
LDGRCEERKERSTQPSRTIQWEPCQAATGWRGEERKGKPSSKAKTAKSAKYYLQRATYWTAAVRRGKKGQRYRQEQFSGNRVGRRLDGEERKVNATVNNSPVGTVSGGGWMERSAKPIKAAKKYILTACTLSDGRCEERKERSTRPSRTI